MTKSEARAARKIAAAVGATWTAERREDGGLEIVRPRTAAQERKHERAMARWAKWHDELNGAPQGECDR